MNGKLVHITLRINQFHHICQQKKSNVKVSLFSMFGSYSMTNECDKYQISTRGSPLIQLQHRYIN